MIRIANAGMREDYFLLKSHVPVDWRTSCAVWLNKPERTLRMNEVDITVVCDPGEKDSVASILRGKGFEASTFRDVPHYISVRTLPEYLRVIQAIPGVRYAEIDRGSLSG